MAVRFLRIHGGRLEAVRRGSPPPAPAGYEQSSYDPFIYIPILAPCQYRSEIMEVNVSCGCSKGMALFCNHFNHKVLPQECRKCEVCKNDTTNNI